MKRIVELDGLRFFAIMTVLAVHYRPPHRPHLEFLSLGWVGVDLFFVLSGFLITSNLMSLRGTAHPFRVFYWRRTLRILPPYYLVLIPLISLLVYEHTIDGRYAWSRVLFLDSITSIPILHLVKQAWLHGIHLVHSSMPVDQHLFTRYRDGFGVFWSLSVEELFYILWAPVVLKASIRNVLALSVLVLTLSPFLRAFIHSGRSPE